MAFGHRKRKTHVFHRGAKRRRRGLVPRRVLRRRIPARRSARRIKSNLEVKSQVHDIRTMSFGYHVGSESLGPSNSLCLLAGLFGGDYPVAADVTTGLIPGTGCTDVIGCWTTPAYPSSMKLDISYKELVFTEEPEQVAFPNPNLRIIHGFYKNTGDKMNADLASNATWIHAVRVALLRELFDSDFTADYLAYTQKSRNIKILSDKLIRPRKPNAVAGPATTSSAIYSPNSQLSYKWPHSKHKTRLQPTVQAGVEPPLARMVPHNQWVPFLLLLAPGILTAESGALIVRSVTKAYFNDA